MSKRKLVLVIALILVTPMVLAGCSKGKPAAKSETEAFEDTLKGFFSAYNSGNYDKCLTYMVGMTLASEGARGAMKTGLKMSHSNTGDIKLTKIENIAIGASSGTADLTATVRGCTMTWEATLEKWGDSWSIDIEKLFGSE